MPWIGPRLINKSWDEDNQVAQIEIILKIDNETKEEIKWLWVREIKDRIREYEIYWFTVFINKSWLSNILENWS